ncbi:Na+-transporting NADH:ubiquinone oxidoreductase subunit NqrB [Catenuloplanes nepalensis]|uniref:Na+-transporting NADH:ubiquinone oxidoreductase subunit NqrB n=1 Tax=Catenuloplanes nepalensis TaxID=587533 RepID=A0ABT9MZP9_9ACTN|nr:hypothetical protein [Catenuloplanes nepalensis]MDP9796918.1 Na+-transporting NADH:ubiquinone oxidoreductase subunit NqrB [Catenuloplanes nepalensis]
MMVLARVAALLGLAGAVVHLALTGAHASHAPLITLGLIVLALVCVPCSVRLWRSPHDRSAWRGALVVAGVMTMLHLIMRPDGGMLAAVLGIATLQAMVGTAALHRRSPAPTGDHRPPTATTDRRVLALADRANVGWPAGRGVR